MPPSKPKAHLPLVHPASVEWQIEKLVPGGDGFLRLEGGKNAFVSGALPGERIRVEGVEQHMGYLRATRWSLLEASLDRVEPSCPVQSQCGGCDWMTLGYAAQVVSKQGILIEALQRTGRFRQLPEIRFVPSIEQVGYRSRIRVHVAAGGRLGFFAAGSHELVEIPTCIVADPELSAALVLLRAVVRRHLHAIAQLREIELRVALAGPRVSLHLLPAVRGFDSSSPFVAELARSFQVSVAEQASDPLHDQRFPLPGAELRAPGGAFTQVNWPVNRALVQTLLDAAQKSGVLRFCDLYCGAGNFSLPLLACGLTGIGIEASKTAIGAARRAAKEQSLSGARFIVGDVRRELERLPRGERFDLAVLDPPRSGAQEVLPALIRRAPRHIAYCACDPVTLARDLRVLSSAGYALDGVTGFDMFPQTHHFETLAWLTLNAAGAAAR